MQVVGLQLAEQFTAKHIQLLAQDPNEKQNVKKFGDMLGKLMNLVKAFAQRQAEAAKKQQAQGGQDGEVAKDLIKAQSKSRISEATAAQKLKQKDVSFAKGEQRKDIQTRAAIKRDNAKAVAESFQNAVKKSSSPLQEGE